MHSPYAPSRRNGTNGRVQGQGDNPSSDARRRKLLADAAIAEANARKLERENEIEEGQLHHIDDLGRNVAALVLWLKACVENFPDRQAAIAPGDHRAAVQAEAEAEVRSWLRYIATWSPFANEVTADDMILQAADVIRRKRAKEQQLGSKNDK